MRFASEHGRVIVTHDEDYHMLLAARAATTPSVVRLRVMLPVPGLAQLITATLDSFHDALMAGAAVSITSRGARMHRLPLG
jgi:predicted nuclease of predicted toxin-antitoxin system